MGTCLGHCFKTTRKYNRCQTLYFCNKDLVEFERLVENEEPTSKRFCLLRSFSSILSVKKKKVSEKRIGVELIEDSWSNCFSGEPIAHDCLPSHLSLHHLETFLGGTCHHNGEFQPLDPRELLVSHPHGAHSVAHERVVSHSTPPSSIDLEWEHEESCYVDSQQEEKSNSISRCRLGHQQFVHHLPKAQTCTRQSSITIDSSSASKDNSRITTPDSLEWDFVDTTIPCIDRETELLIAEIEHLAARALDETGEHLFNSSENISVNEIS